MWAVAAAKRQQEREVERWNTLYRLIKDAFSR